MPSAPGTGITVGMGCWLCQATLLAGVAMQTAKSWWVSGRQQARGCGGQMRGRRGFVGIALAPGALMEAAWLPSKGENRGAGLVQKKRYLCDRDGSLQG